MNIWEKRSNSLKPTQIVNLYHVYFCSYVIRKPHQDFLDAFISFNTKIVATLLQIQNIILTYFLTRDNNEVGLHY